MQASQTHSVDEHMPVQVQVQVQERLAAIPSQLELELRYHIGLMEIDMRMEMQRSVEYRRMMLEMIRGGHPGQLLPPPMPEGEMMPIPALAGVSLSPSVAHRHPAAALPVPYGAAAQAGHATTWERRLTLPSSLVPSSSSSSQLSDGLSRSGRGRGRSRGGRGRTGRTGAVASIRFHHQVPAVRVCIMSSGFLSSAHFSLLSL